MRAIKSFVYLDEYKMYSISSQIFGGLTEYLIDYQGTTKEEDESQRGPLGSGRVMADILKSESRIEERKYLHDYSYTLFEQYLRENKRVCNISENNVDSSIDVINNSGFVEVRSKAIFNDMKILKSTLQRFNELGEALTYAINYEELQKVRQQLETFESSIRDRNAKARLRAKTKSLNDIEQLAKSSGLHQDPTLLKKLVTLMDYGFQDQFEVQMPMGGYIFSANLKREHLRDDEQLLVKKYSRFSEKDFVLFGTIAQTPSKADDDDGDDDEGSIGESTPQHLKEAIMLLVEALSGVEATFSGKLWNEVVIDPIALYREV